MWAIISVLATNLMYAMMSILMAIIAIWLAFRVLDRLTTLEPEEELQKGNIAVAIFYAGIFIAIGLSMGQVLSRSLV